MFSHTGTHIDAPAHLFENGKSLESFSGNQFVGSAVVIDCSELKEGDHIDMDFIERNREKAEEADFLLFRTDWDKKWGTSDYFGNFPCITREVSDFIVTSGKKGVGLDVISIDPINGSKLENHRKILSQNTIVIIENLCNLKSIGNGLFTFIAAPLKFENSDGAPTRAFALIE